MSGYGGNMPPDMAPMAWLRKLGEADTTWTKQGSCRGQDLNLWFPNAHGRAAIQQAEQAKEICRSCPVWEPCLKYALRFKIEDGIWGGQDERERRKIRRALVAERNPEVEPPRGGGRAPVKKPRPLRGGAKHGTRSGYNSGCGCDGCREANRNYERERAALRRNERARIRDRATDLPVGWDPPREYANRSES